MKNQIASVPDHYQKIVSHRCQDHVNIKEYIYNKHHITLGKKLNDEPLYKLKNFNSILPSWGDITSHTYNQKTRHNKLCCIKVLLLTFRLLQSNLTPHKS
jgi:hypothetical protein